MKKLLIILMGFFAVTSLMFVGCSKNDNTDPNNNNSGNNNNNGCPDGYYGIGCQFPWNVSVLGTWKDDAGKLVYITVSTTNPKSLIVKDYFTGYGISTQPPKVDVIGTMTDSMSFILEPTDLQYLSDSLLSGKGTVDPNGLKIIGNYTMKYVQQAGVDHQGNHYYDTLTKTINYTWTKQ